MNAKEDSGTENNASDNVFLCLELQMAATLQSLLERIHLKQAGLGLMGILLIRAGKLRSCSPKDRPNNSSLMLGLM